MAPLFLRLAFQFFDKTLPDTVEPRQESAPKMLVAPEILSRFWVYYGQVGVSRGGLCIIVGHRIFRHVAVLDAAGLATSEDDMPIETIKRKYISANLSVSGIIGTKLQSEELPWPYLS